MKITASLLFAKYALPCGHKHVKGGMLTQKELDDSIEMASHGIEIPEKNLKVYETALNRCERIAKKLKMKEIDGLVVREYFLKYHNRIIDRMCSSKSAPEGIEPERCKVRLGEVREVYEKTALVDVVSKQDEYRKDFAMNVKPGDRVSVHYDFIAEVLGKEILEKYFA